MSRLSILTITAAAVLMSAASAGAQAPLKSALDGKAPPFAMPRMDGTIEGMTVDMTHEIGKRLNREITIDAMSFSALIPALQAGTYDFLSVPFVISEERAQAFLLTEGIWAANISFLLPANADQVGDFTQLKGKVIATNQGNVDDKWARERIEEYGWKIEAYGSLNDAAQAVQAGRADAAIVNDITALSIAKANPALKVSDLRHDTGRYFSYAIPLGSEELREQIELQIECIKADGTAAKIYEKWLGSAPEAGSLTVTPQAGIGPEGYAHYDATPHELSCQ